VNLKWYIECKKEAQGGELPRIRRKTLRLRLWDVRGSNGQKKE